MNETQIFPLPPTAMLKAVHLQMKDLFAQYNGLGAEEGEAKRGVFHEIQEGLRIHLEIEEVLFYPAVQGMQADLAVSVVLKAVQAHRQVKALLEQLRALDSIDGSLDVTMADLQRCVLSHLEVEETEIFPHARALPVETQRELSLEMEKLQDRLRKNPGGR